MLAGVTAGAVILIVSATGAVLAPKPRLLAAIDRDVRTLSTEVGALSSPVRRRESSVAEPSIGR